MRILIIALIAGLSAQVSAAPITQKLKPISESLATLVAMTEQLGAPQSQWDDPKIPGAAADRKAQLTESGCTYDLPTGMQQQSAPGLMLGKIEISGPNCPINMIINITGKTQDKKLEAVLDLKYKLLNRAAFPNDDLQEFNFKVVFTGLIDADQAAGYVKMDVTGLIEGNGVSFSQGVFKNNGTYKIIADIGGFNFKFSQEQVLDVLIAGQTGKFKSESKLEMFNAVENFWIDDVVTSKDDYRKAMSEFKMPFFNTGMTPASNSKSNCQSQLFLKSAVSEQALKDYVANGTEPTVAPAKALNSCQVNMERSTSFNTSSELKSTFQFGREYMLVRSEMKTPTGNMQAKPLYVVYDERQGRVESADSEHYLVQLCEPVAKCP